MEVENEYNPIPAKLCASLLWFVCRLSEDGNALDVPEVTNPIYAVNGKAVSVKPEVIDYLTTPAMYTVVVTNGNQSFWDLLQTLAHSGIYVMDSDDDPITELDLLQKQPFKLSAHLALMDAIMMFHCNKLVTVQHIVDTVKRFSAFNASKELPFDLEDAILLWLNKINQVNMSCMQQTISNPSSRIHKSQLLEKKILPQNTDIVECLRDGKTLLSVLLFYLKDFLTMDSIKLASILCKSERVHNIELFRGLCAEHVCTSVYALRLEDFMCAEEKLKTNFLVLFCEMFVKLEMSRDREGSCVYSGLERRPAVLEDNFVKNSLSKDVLSPSSRTQSSPSHDLARFSSSEASGPSIEYNISEEGTSRTCHAGTPFPIKLNCSLSYEDGVKLVETAINCPIKNSKIFHQPTPKFAEYKPIKTLPSKMGKDVQGFLLETCNEQELLPRRSKLQSNTLQLRTLEEEANEVFSYPPPQPECYSYIDDDDVLSTITETTEPEAPSLYSFRSRSTSSSSHTINNYFADNRWDMEDEVGGFFVDDFSEKFRLHDIRQSLDVNDGVIYKNHDRTLTCHDDEEEQQNCTLETKQDDIRSLYKNKELLTGNKDTVESLVLTVNNPGTSLSNDTKQLLKNGDYFTDRSSLIINTGDVSTSHSLPENYLMRDTYGKQIVLKESYTINNSSTIESAIAAGLPVITKPCEDGIVQTEWCYSGANQDQGNEMNIQTPISSVKDGGSEEFDFNQMIMNDSPEMLCPAPFQSRISQNKSPTDENCSRAGMFKGWPFADNESSHRIREIEGDIEKLYLGDIRYCKDRELTNLTWLDIFNTSINKNNAKEVKIQLNKLQTRKKPYKMSTMSWGDSIRSEPNMETESEPLSARLAALRMQLEEKRRQFEEKKKQKQREISRERSRVLKDAFFVVSSTGKENTNLLANNNTSQSNMWEIRFDEEFQVPELPKPNQPQSEIELLKPKVPTRQYSLQSSKEVLSPVTLSDDARPQIEEQEEKGIEKNEVESIPMEESHYLSTRIDEPLQKSLHEEREMVPAVHVSETEELKKNTEAKTMNGFHFTTPSQLEYNLSGNHRNSYHAHNSFENTQVLFETPQMSPDGFDVQPACDLGSQLHFESMPVNEEVPYEPPIEKNTAQVLPQIMVNKSSPNKSCAFTFNDIGDSSQEMTPDQKRKKERFIRMRIKKQQEEKANKETALEKKRIESEKLVAEKQAKEEDRKRLEQECANAYLLREASQLQHRLYNKHLHEITYNVNPVQRKELPTSGQSHQKAIVGQTNQVESRPDPPLRQLVQGSQEESTHNFSEYNGPGSYQKPSGKSNRKIVQNAIMHACLCGEVNKEAKNKCLAALAQSNANHFLVLFREGLKFRSVYSYNPDSGAVARIYGVGPKTITPKMMLKFYKYNSGAKEFYSLETKHLSIQVDGFMIKKELWEKKPGLSKINSASKHREPILTMDRR